ncbi:MAG: ORF6N domain-containing protein [Rickettsiales bacterium]|nr:ORF6N domain-containing protein [Rickettsiales bacterium]
MKTDLIISNTDIENKIILIEDKPVILDVDVAGFYGVETRAINQAVKNNPNKFPDGYIIELDKEVKNELIKNFDRLDNLKHSTTNIKAFTEKGLYMLATILKGERATKITIKIIDTFAKFKEITSDLSIASNVKNQEEKANVLQRAGLNLMDLLTENLHQETITTKTRITLDLGIIKVEREVEKSKSK